MKVLFQEENIFQRHDLELVRPCCYEIFFLIKFRKYILKIKKKSF